MKSFLFFFFFFFLEKLFFDQKRIRRNVIFTTTSIWDPFDLNEEENALYEQERDSHGMSLKKTFLICGCCCIVLLIILTFSMYTTRERISNEKRIIQIENNSSMVSDAKSSQSSNKSTD
ncbi:unnamed protein product [Rotaria sordida]|uniref:Uncharacterized protein n=1 Tax=Rotaria sordida TaxID=392033 RepID=A0A818Z5W2_9BILA|nr:unnamed protein product [Rotaria sordida]CAF3763751.1 unnamed protein product [Rotaria sordida]CAF3789946.1 unnamed protein product [Rotaria sordida]